MRKRIDRTIFIPTGAAILNLRLSGTPFGGYPLGRIINIIGDSFAGKTLLSWTMFAEVSNDSFYDDYELYYDEPEASLSFDVAKLFGRKTQERVITGENTGRDKKFADSETIQDFGRQLFRIIAKGKPFIYLLDSFDPLELVSENKKKVAGESGYKGAEKTRVLSEILRRTNKHLKRMKSNLFIISQVRDNLNAMMGPTKTRAGGRALKHYSAQEIWLYPIRALKDKNKTEIGTEVLIKTTKNRHARNGIIRLHTSWNYGVDGISTSLDFLQKNGVWKKKGGKLSSPFGLYTKKKLIKIIENDNLEPQLIEEVGRAWTAITAAADKTTRKRKYE